MLRQSLHPSLSKALIIAGSLLLLSLFARHADAGFSPSDTNRDYWFWALGLAGDVVFPQEPGGGIHLAGHIGQRAESKTGATLAAVAQAGYRFHTESLHLQLGAEVGFGGMFGLRLCVQGDIGEESAIGLNAGLALYFPWNCVGFLCMKEGIFAGLFLGGQFILYGGQRYNHNFLLSLRFCWGQAVTRRTAPTPAPYQPTP